MFPNTPFSRVQVKRFPSLTIDAIAQLATTLPSQKQLSPPQLNKSHQLIESWGLVPRRSPYYDLDYSDYRLTLRQLQFLLYWAIVYSFRLCTAGHSWRERQLGKVLSYSIFVLAVLRTGSTTAQNIEPLPPDRRPLPLPQPLPPNNRNLLDESLSAPPLPESVVDIPGTIVVERFNFVGSTVFSQAELNQAIARYTDRPVSFARLIEAANAITQLYLERGYITSGAYLPEQSLESGVVQIQIVEGTLAEIEVDVTEGRLKESYVRDRLEKRIGTPLNIDRLQSALQLLQSNPTIKSLNAELSTGIEPGTSFLTVSVIGADTFGLVGKLNNSRNLSVGTFERGVGLEEANLSGIGDKFALAYYNTDGSNQYEANYTLPINTRDGFLRFDFRLNQNQIIQSSFEDIDLEIESRNYDLTWRQPVLQTATPEVSQELAFSVTASRRESQTTILNVPQPISPGADENGEICTSIVSLSQEWLQRNRRQVISARSQFNFGLDVLDATVIEEEPNSQFFSWRGQFSYLRLLGNPTDLPAVGSTILLNSQLQLSADSLISTEQFSLGGATTVRGYSQDALLTDNGFLASAEFRLPIARLSQLDATVQLTPFVDFGTGWNTDNEETEFTTLIGTGLGLLLQTPERLSARLDWGIPLVNSDSDDGSLQENGVYLQLEYSFF